MKPYKLFLYFLIFLTSCSVNKNTSEFNSIESFKTSDLKNLFPLQKTITPKDIILEKDIVFDKYLLADTYPYKDTVRVFQWDKVKKLLAHLEDAQKEPSNWGILSNYKNQNKEATLVYNHVRNDYTRIADTLGVERFQSSPLYLPGDSVQPVRYGRDGWLVHLESPDTLDMIRVKGVSFDGTYDVPRRYLIPWGDTIKFNKVIVVDLTNQNTATLEKRDNTWFVRSTNPCTTGRHKPPYAQETPTGIFAVQQKKIKMYYTHDGSTELAGYAPYATRFTNGAHIHGVPTNSIDAPIIEYSYTLGTIPRSHMCVRNASSHAKLIFDWAKIKESVVVVID